MGHRGTSRFPPPLLPPPPPHTVDMTAGTGWHFTQEGPFAPPWTVAPIPGVIVDDGGPHCPLGGPSRLRKLHPAALGRCYFAALPLCGTEGSAPIPPARRALVLDVDGCVIKPTEGKRFCQTEFDWEFTSEAVPWRVAAFAAAGYKVVLFTNQAGVAAGSTSARVVKKRMEQVVKR